jgi:hypothetical protein
MQQTWHIFKKDVRYLYWEIAFLLVLATISTWSAQGEYSVLGLLYAAAVAYTVARLIHAEAIPGENQFWITRPYRWPSLLTAKILFVMAFIQLPVLLMQLALLLHGGFAIGAILPGLLWTQALILLAISLPCFALAAMTVGLVPFIATILVLVAIGIVAAQDSSRSMTYAPESIDWVLYSIPLVAALIAVPPVLYMQYKNRQTRRAVMLAVGITLSAVIVFAAVPWTALFSIQCLLSRQTPHIEIARDPAKPFTISKETAHEVTLSLPLVIKGLSPDVRLQVEVFDLHWQTAEGRNLHLGPGRVGLRRVTDDNWVLSGTQFVDRSFLATAADPATLRASFYMTLFGNRRDKTIPFQRTPVDAMDGLRCLAAYQDEIVCRAPFRWPGTLVSAKAPWGGLSSFTRLISYSPFPANLQLDPIMERSAGPHWSKDRESPREVTIEIEEPLAYLQRDVEVPNVSLGAAK